MKRTLTALFFAFILVLSVSMTVISLASADQPPGQPPYGQQSQCKAKSGQCCKVGPHHGPNKCCIVSNCRCPSRNPQWSMRRGKEMYGKPVGWILLALFLAPVAIASDNSIYAKHLHMGGPNHECSDCHDLSQLTPLKGKYANMGGPNHECVDCHNGVKAPELPLPTGYTSCSGDGGCHPTK